MNDEHQEVFLAYMKVTILESSSKTEDKHKQFWRVPSVIASSSLVRE
jgi:hypothetical protein